MHLLVTKNNQENCMKLPIQLIFRLSSRANLTDLLYITNDQAMLTREVNIVIN